MKLEWSTFFIVIYIHPLFKVQQEVKIRQTKSHNQTIIIQPLMLEIEMVHISIFIQPLVIEIEVVQIFIVIDIHLLPQQQQKVNLRQKLSYN